MFVQSLATASDVRRILGDLDPLTVARILAIAPTRDELDEAVIETADELQFGEEPRTPSSARVASVRAILADVLDEVDDDAYVVDSADGARS